MNPVLLPQEVESPANHSSYLHELFDKSEQILRQHRLENPDLYRMVEARKANLFKEANATKAIAPVISSVRVPKSFESIYFKQTKQEQLKRKIAANQKFIHEQNVATQSVIIPRTQARNVKQSHRSIEDVTADRENKLEAQIKAWRSILPILIKRFSKINDPRRAKSVKHKLAVVMLYGLLAFIFRLSSRREINRELSGGVIFNNLKKLFPALESIPHADTVARVLEKINVNEIEKTHILLVRLPPTKSVA